MGQIIIIPQNVHRLACFVWFVGTLQAANITAFWPVMDALDFLSEVFGEN